MDYDDAINLCGWLSCGVNNECKQALSIAIKSMYFAKEVRIAIKQNEYPEYFDEDVRTLYEKFLKEFTNEGNK